MSNFTPGPWKADRAGFVSTCTDDAALICECNQDPHWQPDGVYMHPNARLIAAVPELLEALEKAVEPLSEGEDCGLSTETYNFACKIIAKATT